MSTKPKNEPKIDAPRKKDPNERIRLLATREEIVDSKLSQLQIEDMRATVIELLDEEERINGKKEESGKNFASQLKTNRLQIDELRRKITSGRRRDTIVVEEYLTGSNEVVRIRADTGERIGARTATLKELQEEMFSDTVTKVPPNEADPADGVPEMEFGTEQQ